MLGGAVGPGGVLFAQALGQQGVDAHAGAHRQGNHNVLNWKGQGHRVEGVLAELRDEYAVHHVVECLHQHGQHHGHRHGNQQPVDGHDAHLVLLGYAV